MGLLGQNITSDENLVWVTKTHYPHAIPGDKPFKAEKMLVIARNPIDVIVSFANLLNTHSHSLEVNERYDVDRPDFWGPWVSGMIAEIKANHADVLSESASQIPTFFLRYEDLKLNPEPILVAMFCFLLEVDSLEGTLCLRKIKEVASSGFTNKTAYALKSNSMNLCRNRHMYSAQQLSMMRDELSDMISFWEYNKGKTCFFYGVE